MTPPFDADRAANNELESQDLGGVQFPEQEQEFPAAIDTPEEQSDEEEQEQEQESSDASLSSVQQYLQDIGSVPLLSREREIELAKEVESATQQIFEALFSTPFALHRVIEFGRALRAGEIELRDIIAKSEDDDDEGISNIDPKPFLKLVAKLSRQVEHWERIWREANRARVSEIRRQRLAHDEKTQLIKILGTIKELRLASDQLEKMITQLSSLAERIAGLEEHTRSHSRSKRENAATEIQSI